MSSAPLPYLADRGARSTEHDRRDSFFEAAASLDFQASDGALPTFEMLASTGRPIRQWWSRSPVVLDMSGVRHGDELPILRQHNPDRIIGHASVSINGSEISAHGVISGTGDDAEEVKANARNGYPWQASVGGDILDLEEVKTGKLVTVNGERYAGPVTIVRSLELREISFVTLGADAGTSAKVAASAGGADMTFEEWLQSQGIDPEALTETGTKTLRAMFEAQQSGAPASPPVATDGAGVHDDIFDRIEATEERSEAEVARQEELVAMYEDAAARRPAKVGEFKSILTKAIHDGARPERFKLQLMRAARSYPMVGVRSDDGTPQRDLLTAAALQSCQVAGHEKMYPDQVQQAAHDRFRGRLGLLQMLTIAANASGEWSGTETDFRSNLAAGLQAAFSNGDISNVLADSANKMVLPAFQAVEQSWRRIAHRSAPNDFKEYKMIRLTGGLEYELLAEGGKIRQGTIGDEVFTNRARTYAKNIALTREDIINDDLGMLDQVMRMLGRGAALAINTVFWTEFMANSAFFTAANKNFIDGTDSVLGLDSLTSAETLFYDQVDSDKNPMALSPAVLLVPNALKTRADRWMRSTATNLSTTGGTSQVVQTEQPDDNPHAGKFEVVRSSYLSNAKIPGNSTTAWYLLANPNDLAVIDIGFLNGRDVPFVENVGVDPDQLGIKMRGYHDMGVRLQDHRAGVKVAGA